MNRSLLLFLSLLCSLAQANGTPVLEAKFSCSQVRQENGDGERLNYADQAVLRIKGTEISTFQWESSLFRSTHGHDCSIDDGDEPQAKLTEKGWRISLKDSVAARNRRGYDFERGLDCSINLELDGERLKITPSCPALCGSRVNFSALTVDLKTGSCQYEEK
jgi:hypothetical protein